MCFLGLYLRLFLAGGEPSVSSLVVEVSTFEHEGSVSICDVTTLVSPFGGASAVVVSKSNPGIAAPLTLFPDRETSSSVFDFVRNPSECVREPSIFEDEPLSDSFINWEESCSLKGREESSWLAGDIASSLTLRVTFFRFPRGTRAERAVKGVDDELGL